MKDLKIVSSSLVNSVLCNSPVHPINGTAELLVQISYLPISFGTVVYVLTR